MSATVKELKDTNFQETIAKGVTLVDFWAPWCGPCRMQAPILDQVADEIKNKAVIAKVNIDENMTVATEFAVRSIPTLLLFKEGKLVKQYVGLQRKDDLIQAIEQTL